jgi:hypothetical protein
MAHAHAWLHLPDSPQAARLRAGLMAADILPQVLRADRQGWARQIEPLVAGAPGVVFVDVTDDPMVPGRPLERVLQSLPAPLHARTHLTRLLGGHASPADTDWVRTLGFAGLWTDLGGAADVDALKPLVQAAAQACGAAPPDAATLTRFVRVLQRRDDEAADARARVHARTGVAPETLAAQWAQCLPTADRRYHLRTWPRCLLGHEAVHTIAREHGLARAEAVALGQDMGALGLLHHVTGDHRFDDAALFYRLAWSAAADAVPLDAAMAHLADAAVLPTRETTAAGQRLGACWSGHDAVTAVASRWQLDRVDATIVLHRLMAWGCFEHALRTRPFVDDDSLYRWRPRR